MIAFTAEEFDFQRVAIQHIKNNWEPIKARNGRVIGYQNGNFKYQKRIRPIYVTYGRKKYNYGWSVSHNNAEGILFHDIEDIKRGIDSFCILNSDRIFWEFFKRNLTTEISKNNLDKLLEKGEIVKKSFKI